LVNNDGCCLINFAKISKFSDKSVCLYRFFCKNDLFFAHLLDLMMLFSLIAMTTSSRTSFPAFLDGLE